MSKILPILVFINFLFIPSTFAFGDFFKKIDDAFENLNEALDETEKPVEKESLKQKKSPVIKKNKLKNETPKNKLRNQNNSESNKQMNQGYENQTKYNNQMNPKYGNQLEVIENEVDF
tara:strand:- start:543 stop:896 length:354 start_codon:yes stop_codon:yes gene_type:complete